MIISTCLSLYILLRRDCMEGLNFEKCQKYLTTYLCFPLKLCSTRGLIKCLQYIVNTNVNISNLHDYNKSVLVTFFTLLKIESVK